eukprot:s2435_g10.t1
MRFFPLFLIVGFIQNGIVLTVRIELRRKRALARFWWWKVRTTQSVPSLARLKLIYKVFQYPPFQRSFTTEAHPRVDLPSRNDVLAESTKWRGALVLRQLQNHEKSLSWSLRSLWPVLGRRSGQRFCLQLWSPPINQAQEWQSKCGPVFLGRSAMGAASQTPIQETRSGRSKCPAAATQPASRGRGKGRGPRQDNSKSIALPPPQADPPWNMSAPALHMMPAPLPPPATSTQLDPQTAELIAMISTNPDSCPPEVQAAFHAFQAKYAQKESKILRSAVTHLTKAKRELADAQLHRSNLHSSWIKFLQESIAKWQDCGRQFREQEDAAVSRIRAAQALYTTAYETLNRTKAGAGVTNTEEVVDAEVENDLKEVSTANSSKISESLAHLQSSLSELHQSAEELAAQELHAVKRPRLEADANMEGSPALPGVNHGHAAFWSAGPAMTTQYPGLGQGPNIPSLAYVDWAQEIEPGHCLTTPMLPMSWLHSCVHKPWFLSPWAALHNATFLTLEIAGDTSFASPSHCCRPVPMSSVTGVGILHTSTSRGILPPLQFPDLVSFADTVDVVVFHEPTAEIVHFSCSLSAFQAWTEKPWGLYPSLSLGSTPLNFATCCQVCI